MRAAPAPFRKRRNYFSARQLPACRLVLANKVFRGDAAVDVPAGKQIPCPNWNGRLARDAGGNSA